MTSNGEGGVAAAASPLISAAVNLFPGRDPHANPRCSPAPGGRSCRVSDGDTAVSRMHVVRPVVQNPPLAVRPLVTHEGSDKTLTPQQDYFRVGGEHDSQLGETQKSQTCGMVRNTMLCQRPSCTPSRSYLTPGMTSSSRCLG